MEQHILDKLKQVSIRSLLSWLNNDYVIRKCEKDNLANNVYELYNLNTAGISGWGPNKESQLNEIKSIIEKNAIRIINNVENSFPKNVCRTEAQQIIYDKLKDIPLMEMYYLNLNYNDYSSPEKQKLIRYYNLFIDRGIKTIADFYDLSSQDYLSFEGVGVSKLDRFENEKKFIEDSIDSIIGQWIRFNEQVELPRWNTDNKSFCDNFLELIKDIIDLINLRKSDAHYKKLNSNKDDNTSSFDEIRYTNFGSMLELFFIQDKNLDEVAQFLSLSKERCRQNMVFFFKNIFEESDLSKLFSNWENVSVKGCVKNHRVKDNGIWMLEDDFYESYGNMPSKWMPFFFIDKASVGEIGFIIPIDSCILYTSVLRHTLFALKDNCVCPLNRDELIAEVESRLSEDKRYDGGGFDEQFIDSFLEYESLVEKKDGNTFLIREDKLDTDQQKMSRIIYNGPSPMSTDVVREIFHEKYSTYPVLNSSVLKSKNIHHGNAGWYIGDEKPRIHKRIASFAEENIVFSLDELKNCLINEGYVWEEEKTSTYRAYITQVCLVDNDNDKHFCLKGCSDSYPNFNWRKPTILGLSNWMYNKINCYLGNEECAKLDAIINYLKLEAQNTEYKEINFKSRIFMLNHSRIQEAPFIIEDNMVKKNRPYYENINFEYAGLRGGQYPHFIQIRNAASNALKSSENGRLRLIEFISSFNNVLSKQLPRKLFIDAIENKRLEPIPVSFITENNEKYLVYTGSAIQSEPIYKIELNDDSETVNVVSESSDRHEISFNYGMDWDALTNAILNDLAYVKPVFEKVKLDFDSSVRKFIDFLKKDKNSNFNSILPKNLYEYWCANTDQFDRITYINNLCLFYNPLIKAKHSSSQRIDIEYFNKIKNDLFEKRSYCVEGEPLNLNSIQMAQCICDYTSLYIYTVAILKDE